MINLFGSRLNNVFTSSIGGKCNKYSSLHSGNNLLHVVSQLSYNASKELDIRIINNKFTNNFGVPIVLKHYGCGKVHDGEDVIANLTAKCRIERNTLHGFNSQELKQQHNPNIIHLQ